MKRLINLLLCVLAVIVIVSITNGINRQFGWMPRERHCAPSSSFFCPEVFYQ